MATGMPQPEDALSQELLILSFVILLHQTQGLLLQLQNCCPIYAFFHPQNKQAKTTAEWILPKKEGRERAEGIKRGKAEQKDG